MFLLYLQVMIEINAKCWDYQFTYEQCNQASAIAYRESGFNPLAKNPNSSAKGVYQFIDGTWEYACKGDVLNYKDNIQCFFENFPKNPGWWEETNY